MAVDELNRMLLEVQHAHGTRVSDRLGRRAVWRKMHALAEAQHAEALAFFVSCLDDPDATWRLEAMRCIGFHYPISADEPIMEKVRQMLLTDQGEDGEIRMVAAAVLGACSRWPEPALKQALEIDPDEFVRAAAFSALLDLAGVPLPIIRRIDEQVRSGAIVPSWNALERQLHDHGIDLN